MDNDETISSLICRSIDFGHHGAESLVPEKVKRSLFSKIPDGDFDYDYTVEELGLITNWRPEVLLKLTESLESKYEFCRLSSSQRSQFCLSCVTEDLQRCRNPIWRHSWSNLYYVICERHNEILRSLSGSYGYNDILNRCSQTSRYVIDSMQTDAVPGAYDTSQALLDRSVELVSAGALYTIKQLLIDLCLVIQRDISSDMKAGASFEEGKLLAVTDLYRIMLRTYRKGVDPVPYCFQLADKIRRVIFLPRPREVNSIGEMISGFRDRLDPHSRVVALAMVAVFLNYPHAEHTWLEIARLFKTLGTLMPSSPAALYGLVTGGQELGVRNWIGDRAQECYPRALGQRILDLTSGTAKRLY